MVQQYRSTYRYIAKPETADGVDEEGSFGDYGIFLKFIVIDELERHGQET